MEQLLFVNACVRGERSRTLKLARRFLAGWQTAHPDSAVTRIDLRGNGFAAGTATGTIAFFPWP